ncbi:NAD-dependent epimerase/dehydratase family protein [Nocardioides panacis]|uniref:NAD-dependent epimerase/dehydratase family protein n=1 Tax=Nocardioides panacis TaxID=2849501 RepID=UPI0020B33EE6|nr:NAD-dependent epimerase/dehydratase family protein [Nocardioides panacis]
MSWSPGGAGFIGCALSPVLAGQFDRYVVLDNLHPQVHPTSARPDGLHPAAELHVGDVTSPEDWDAVLGDLRPSTVVHLAAETGTAQSLAESSRHGRVNVVGTTEMLDAFTRIGHAPDHLLLTSSRAVYGEGTWVGADGEVLRPSLRTHAQLEAGRWDHGVRHLPNTVAETIPSPTSVYGATKLAQEHLLASWAGSHDVNLSILRLQNVFGAGQSLTNPYTGIVSLFSQLAREGKAIPLYEDGEITRDFVYITDVVSALTAALEKPPVGGVRRVDVGTGVRTTIRDLATTVAEYHGAPAPVVTGQFRDGDVRHASCLVDATREELGWTPQVTMAEGVALLQEWIAAQQG